jgi:hypothetical protein
MTDETRDLERRGRRVAGMVALMMGAGVILDSPWPWPGLALFLAGFGLWVSGFMAKGAPAVLAEKAREES